MGIVLSRVRKKKSTIEALEKLDNDIKEIEENQRNAQRKYKKITKLLLVYSLGLYIICGIIFYFNFTSTLKGKLLYLVPLAISPLLLYIVKRIISWYFIRLINKNQLRLNEMKIQKKIILEEVKDKETYKVATQILEKFSGEIPPKPSYNMQLAPIKHPDNELKKRIVSTTASFPKTQLPNNIMRGFVGTRPSQPISSGSIPSRGLTAVNAPWMQLPAPILSLQRTYLDRVVEYLIGDGPNNRYALICSQCHSHNGMALKEEFEYIGFKCCYCFFYNPARKIRPEAPRLESPSILLQESDSDSEKTSEGNSDEGQKPALDSDKTSGESFDENHKTAIGDCSTVLRKSSETLDTNSDIDSRLTKSSINKQNDEAPKENDSNSTSPEKAHSEETE